VGGGGSPRSMEPNCRILIENPWSVRKMDLTKSQFDELLYYLRIQETEALPALVEAAQI
jgi:hypothetical protein